MSIPTRVVTSTKRIVIDARRAYLLSLDKHFKYIVYFCKCLLTLWLQLLKTQRNMLKLHHQAEASYFFTFINIYKYTCTCSHGDDIRLCTPKPCVRYPDFFFSGFSHRLGSLKYFWISLFHSAVSFISSTLFSVFLSIYLLALVHRHPS